MYSEAFLEVFRPLKICFEVCWEYFYMQWSHRETKKVELTKSPHKTHFWQANRYVFPGPKSPFYPLGTPSLVPFRSLPVYILSAFSTSRFLRCVLGVSSIGLHVQKSLVSTSYLIICINATIVMDGETCFSMASDSPKCRFIAIT